MSTLNFKKINNILALVCTLALIVIAASIISKVVWQIIDKEASFPISKAFSNDVDTGSSFWIFKIY